MPFFTFNQNNSGGFFEGPAHYVIVEARDDDEANERAEREAGLYFYGVNDGIDCECCGDRWYEASRKGTDTPSIFGKPVEQGFSKAVRNTEIPLVSILRAGKRALEVLVP